MISIRIDQTDIKKIENQINKKISGLEEIILPRSLTEISKAVFTITGKQFIRSINRDAKANKNLSHMYEWKKSGINTKRLFLLNRSSVQNGHLVISTKFLKSKEAVPIKKELLRPGKSGKIVTAKNIFKDKAKIMEAGTPVTIRPRKYLVFPGKGGRLVFIKKPNSVLVRNPGGKGSTNAYKKYINAWYRKNGVAVIDKSMLFKIIEKKVGIALNKKNSGPVEARKAIIEVSQKYSQGLTTLWQKINIIY